MSEKNILAFFKSPEEAQAVESKLKSLQAIDVSIDRFSKYPGEGLEQRMNPITGNFGSLGELTLDADYSNESAAILSAADITASGMSDGGQGGPTGRDILLTAVVQEQDFDKAMEVIKAGGGSV
jgi:hypothetical protein